MGQPHPPAYGPGPPPPGAPPLQRPPAPPNGGGGGPFGLMQHAAAPPVAMVAPVANPALMAAEQQARKRQDYETLCQIISQWNANRLDLFALTMPNEVRKVL